MDVGEAIRAEPSYDSFALSVPPGTHTLTAQGRSGCTNAPLPMVLHMSVFGR